VNVNQRISIQQQHIASFPRFERAGFFLHAHGSCGNNRCRLKSLQRRETCLNIELYFPMQ
jgi:hypothetical protein